MYAGSAGTAELKTCPICPSVGVKTTSKEVNASSYCRGAVRGEIWNDGPMRHRQARVLLPSLRLSWAQRCSLRRFCAAFDSLEKARPTARLFTTEHRTISDAHRVKKGYRFLRPASFRVLCPA